MAAGLAGYLPFFLLGAAVHQVLDGGGGRSVSPRYLLDASIGAPAGVVTAGSFTSRTGYAGQLNEAPWLGDDLIQNLMLSEPFAIRLADLYANDLDPEGDPFTSVVVPRWSLVGGRMSAGIGWIVYLPAPVPLSADEFTYEVDDGVGGRAAAVVRLAARADDPGVVSNRLAMPLWVDEGVLRITFAGVPGRSYVIETTAELSPQTEWQFVFCGISEPSGLLSVTDPAADSGARFYRAREVASCP